MKNKIALLIPYFGKWPEWMELYLYSCANQPFDIHLFTDCLQLPAPENVIYHACSFEDYCRETSERLGIDFKPDNPYKLCDLRPFYGFLHQDLLTDYEFWGFGDIDLIYGDMGKILTPELLMQVDVFSTMADRCSGHYCLLRNNEKLRTKAFRIRHWKMLLTAPHNYILDEKHLSNLIAPEMKWVRAFYARILIRLFGWDRAFRLHSFHLALLAQKVFGYTRRGIHMKEYGVTPEVYDSICYNYQNGIITNRAGGQQVMYLHFLFFKKNRYRNTYLWDNSTQLTPQIGRLAKETLYIDKTGLHF